MAVVESLEAAPTRSENPAKSVGLLAAAFAGTVFISAFLLFQVQPFISKAILPWFGGSPAVWTTCMVFFQVALFLGYAYAHAVTRFVPARSQLTLHLGLLALALVFLPIIPDESLKPQGSEQPVLRILTLLTLTVGLPYFILSTTGPLVQAWFARAFPGRSPYRLYALSNIGSLAALITFPILFEPAFALENLAFIWSGLFAAFAALCAISAYVALGNKRRSIVAPVAAKTHGDEVLPAWWVRALWLLLPAWSCMMLLTVMNYVCQDVAPVPLLFVAPLSLYLLSFIIAFDHPRWYNRAIYAPVMVVALFLVGALDEWPGWIGKDFEIGFAVEVVLYFAALFLVCMTCHGELARLRPPTSLLTEYFLMISAGGAIGGLFVSLVAPRIFTTYFEWNIGLIGSFVSAWLLTISVAMIRFGKSSAVARWGIAVPGLVVAAILAGLIWQWQAWTNEVLYRARNFYGLVSVRDEFVGEPRHHYAFVSGSVRHGRQFADPARRHEPTSYYGRHTGVGQALLYVQDRPNAHVGVVGMGIGTIATFAQPGQNFRFYEINPEVEHIARKYFTFLEDCQGKCDVVLGDARLELERELKEGGSHQYDLLCLDAFSGDSVPAHLLTAEAFKLYDAHLKEDGIICFNITNNYLDLSGVVQALADEFGYETRRIATESDSSNLHYPTDFMLLTKNKNFLEKHPDALPEGTTARHSRRLLWTDRYSNIFSILKQL